MANFKENESATKHDNSKIPQKEIINPNELSTPLSTHFNISWTGNPGAENNAFVEFPNYNGKRLVIYLYITGTPAWGTVGAVTVTPVNCKLNSGESNVIQSIDYGNFNTTLQLTVTPTSASIGKNVQYNVSVRGHENAVIHVRGDINTPL